MSALFPGDMFIGLGFGLGPESDEDMQETLEDAVMRRLFERVKELENKVETLTRTLDIWQEMLGIEVVAVPRVPVFEVVEIHHGICSLCDRQAPLNKQGICEGCSLEAQINHG